MKTVADLCIWISEAIWETQQVEVNWRAIKKFMDDFESDNKLRLELKKSGS